MPAHSVGASRWERAQQRQLQEAAQWERQRLAAKSAAAETGRRERAAVLIQTSVRRWLARLLPGRLAVAAADGAALAAAPTVPRWSDDELLESAIKEVQEQQNLIQSAMQRQVDCARLACPQGHSLAFTNGQRGNCNGCRTGVRDGCDILLCTSTHCNWRLCADCALNELQLAGVDVAAFLKDVHNLAGPGPPRRGSSRSKKRRSRLSAG